MSKEDKKLAEAMRIFEALSNVDEELLARSEASAEAIPIGKPSTRKKSVKKTRPIWYYGKALAACFCLVVCGVALWSVSRSLPKSTESACDTAVNFELAAEDAAEAEEMPVEGECAAAVAEQSAVTSGAGALDSGNSSGSSAEKEEGSASIQEEAALEEKTEEGLEDLHQNINDAVKESCLNDSREVITEVEARATAELGDYIPTVIPAGYVFESARRMDDPETNESMDIMLCWTKGMDSISIYIAKVDVESVTTVDISKPETYDVHLYGIPYAETVPEAYRSSFNDPIFAEDDFSMEIVESRLKIVSDQGDTDTPRGNFAVLYENGILVEFSGRGDVESIYEMMKSIQ